MLRFNRLLLATTLAALCAFPPSVYGRPVRGAAAVEQQQQQRKLQEDENQEGENKNDKDNVVQEGEQSVLDIATGSNDFETLVEALEAANLVEALGGNGPFTVFAPTNDAFEEAEIDFLFSPEWSKHLESVLLYHVVPGSLFTDDLEEGQELSTLLSDSVLNVTSLNDEDGFTVNDVEVAAANISATNGVVHVVEEVLLPAFTELSVVELAAASPGQFSILVDLLTLANLTEALEDGVFTVFAPTNEAFGKLPQADLDSLTAPENSDILSDILLYHVASGIAYADTAEIDDAAITLQGANVTVTAVDGGMVLNGASSVVTPDILANNGVIHAIDTVLMPPDIDEVTDDVTDDEVDVVDATNATVDETTQVDGGDNATDTEVDEGATDDEEDDADNATAIGALDLEQWVFLGEDYSTLYGLLDETGLVTTLSADGPLTLMAPTNDAFGAVPDVAKYSEPEWYAHLYDILLYHVVPGAVESTDLSDGMIALTALGENFTVTSMDPVTINDMSTVIDPDNVVTNGVAHGIDAVLLPPSATSTIVDILASSPFFEELFGLVTAADLEEALGGPGPFTIFAPTNNAIGRLDEETVATLTSEEGLTELQRILQYHVVPGIVLSDDVIDGQMFTTLEGQMLTMTEQGDTFLINDAEIVDGDILASNGVIHVVNRVLIPPPADPNAPATIPVAPEGTTAPESDAPEPVDSVATESPVSVAPAVPETPPTDPEVVTNTTTIAPTEEVAPPDDPVEEEAGTTDTEAPTGTTDTEATAAISGASASQVLSFLAMASTLPFFLLV